MCIRDSHKYSAIKKVVDGITFDSKREAARYGYLKIRFRAGEIRDLVLQPSWEIVINSRKVCKYIADFMYRENGVVVIEDVKGMKTPLYNLKKKLMLAVHGIVITEVK